MLKFLRRGFTVLFIFLNALQFTRAAEPIEYLDKDTQLFYVPINSQLTADHASIINGPILSWFMASTAQQYGRFFSDTSINKLPFRDRCVKNYIIHPDDPTDTLFQVDLRMYTPIKVGSRFNRMVVIRPYDKKTRPCILYTPGNGGNLNAWSNYYMIGVAEMLERGYAVAFYENYNNSFFTNNIQSDSTYKAWAQSNLADSNVFTPEDYILQRGHYLLYQYAYAAQTFLSYIAPQYNLDTNMLFLAGHSAGGLSSMMLAFARPERNFQHPVFSYCGAYDSRCYLGMSNKRIPVKGVLCSAAGLQDDTMEGSYFGPYLDAGQSDKTVVMIHGKQDYLAPVNYGKALWQNFVDSVQMLGPMSLHPLMDNVGIKNFSFINCIGGHGVFLYPRTTVDNSGVFRKMNPFGYDLNVLEDDSFYQDTALYQIKLYDDQMGKIMNNVAQVFSKVYHQESIDLPSAIYTWEPREDMTPVDSLPFEQNWSPTPLFCGIPDVKLEEFNLYTSIPTFVNILPNSELLLYPNPAQDILHVEQNNSISEYMIRDILGKMYFQNTVNTQNFSIDLQGLQTGMYLLILLDKEGIVKAQKKFIVTR